MKKKPVFLVSVPLVLFVLSLALVGCTDQTTSGIINENDIESLGFDSPVLESNVTKKVTVRFTNGNSFDLVRIVINDYGKIKNSRVYDENIVMKPNETRELELDLTVYTSSDVKCGVAVAGFREVFDEQTGEGIIATGGTTEEDIIEVVIEPLPEIEWYGGDIIAGGNTEGNTL
jgi:hypothetical protein